MEIVNIVVDIISSVGFPIACCLLLFYKMERDSKRNQEEVDTLRTSIDKNTEVINKLLLILEGEE